MNEYVCGVPGALEQKAREVARKHHLSGLEEEFFLDFVSHITLDMLGISDSPVSYTHLGRARGQALGRGASARRDCASSIEGRGNSCFG